MAVSFWVRSFIRCDAENLYYQLTNMKWLPMMKKNYICERKLIMYHTIFETGKQVIESIEKTQQKQIEDAAVLIGKAIVNGRKFFVTGSGHSHCVAEEFYGRAGGLACVTPILTPELTLTDHPTKSSQIERLDGYATILVNLYGISEGDVILIASNSGRNAYPVEMALEAQNRGAKVIAITNIKHSSSCTSRAKSGKLLMEVADVVIDNCGELGDSALQVEGIAAPILPTSSIANAFIVQAITVLTAMHIRDAGVEPPIFISLNVMGEENRNDEYFRKYARIY